MADSDKDTWDGLVLSNEPPALRFSTTITFKGKPATIESLRETLRTESGLKYTLPEESALSDLFRRALIKEENDPKSPPYAGASASDPDRRAKEALDFVKNQVRTFPTTEEFARPFFAAPPTYIDGGEFKSRTSKWHFTISVTAPPRFSIDFEVLKSTYGSAINALSVDPDLYTRGTVIYNVDEIPATTIDAEGFRDLIRSALTSQIIDTSLGPLSLEELSKALSRYDYYPGPMEVWASDDLGNTVSIGGAICQVWPDPGSAINSNP